MASELKFKALAPTVQDTIAILAIDRPEVANAFDAEIIASLTRNLRAVAEQKNCRALVLTGRGKHFSAGADLAWMQASAQLSHAENIKDAEKLIDLFSALENLSLPTICAVRGAVFGGAVGLVACSDIAIATRSAKFCLSEVRLGLLPAVILPHLARKMLPGQLRRLSLSARVFLGDEAKEVGLVERVVNDNELAAAVRDELNHLLNGCVTAQAQLKALHKHVVTDSLRQGPHTAEAIATARTSLTGQAGLEAFFAKKAAPWVYQLDEAWSFDD